MPEPPDYAKIERESWAKNARAVERRLDEDEPNLRKRIATFVRRFGFRIEEVRRKIRGDEMFRAHFAMEPRRQGIHEKAAAAWIEALPGVEEFRILPKSGKNAVYITSDGELRPGLAKRPSKSLDFFWKFGDYEIHAAHKYTLEGGGNQDSQFIEMRNLLEMFQKASAGSREVLLVIVDGPYYTEAKMADLRRFLRNSPPFSFAIPIEEIPSVMEGLEPKQ